MPIAFTLDKCSIATVRTIFRQYNPQNCEETKKTDVPGHNYANAGMPLRGEVLSMGRHEKLCPVAD